MARDRRYYGMGEDTGTCWGRGNLVWTFFSREYIRIGMQVLGLLFCSVGIDSANPGIHAGSPVRLPVVAGYQTSPQKVYGLDFSPYMNGQDPNQGTQITANQILSRMQIIAPYTTWIRSFGSANGLENTPSIARQLGLRVAANAWISKDTAKNAVEINNLIAAANAGHVDIAIVGSEAILRNDVTESQLIAYMNQVRQAIPQNIPVTTADVWGTFMAHPNLVAASDVVFANFYPYWEGTAISNAICSLRNEYQQLVNAAGSRPVVVSETGWPTAGRVVGAAIPSAANANLYALQFLSWASANSIPSFYFEAFDESWKGAYEGPSGPNWGIFDVNGVIKPGMDDSFAGQTTAVDCTGLIPGPIAIAFDFVPPYGSYDLLEARVTGVRPGEYVLATYIKVAGGWWTKPTFAQPTVAINVDGTARIPIVTGGTDQSATDIALFLIPSTCSPPQAAGGALPALPCAIASLQINRTQSSISGSISDLEGIPIVGAVVSDPLLGTTTSAPDGKYSFYRITATGTATLTVTLPNYMFGSPKTINIPVSNQIVNFTGAPMLIVTAMALPSGTAGAFYSFTLGAVGGAKPYKNWILGSGTLPPGLSLNDVTGVISGTPTTIIGSPFEFSVTVSDQLGNVSAPQAFLITVAKKVRGQLISN